MRSILREEPIALTAYRALERFPGGLGLLSRVVVRRAPYFRTIRPRIEHLEPGRAEVTMPNRRAVHNHLGTVHAIASCNLVELAAALMTEVTIPIDRRWIPVGMQVTYRAKATTDLRAVAVIAPPTPGVGSDDLVVSVDVVDAARTVVVHAGVTMRVSPRTSKS